MPNSQIKTTVNPISKTINKKETKELAGFAKALGNPTRVAILKHLQNNSCCFVGNMVDVFPLSQSTISQHLKELKKAGLVEGKSEPPKIRYCINQKNWNRAKDLLECLFSK